jgi:hypothetical protein
MPHCGDNKVGNLLLIIERHQLKPWSVMVPGAQIPKICEMLLGLGTSQVGPRSNLPAPLRLAAGSTLLAWYGVFATHRSIACRNCRPAEHGSLLGLDTVKAGTET